MVDEPEHALAEVLGSVRLEGSEASSEVRDALERLATDGPSVDQLDELAKRAAAGELPHPARSPRAA